MNLYKTITMAAVVGLSAIASAQYDFVVLSTVSSESWGAGPGQQVGINNVTGHAMLWNGGVSAGVDLHPLGWTSSIAVATDGTYQAGTVSDSTSHAARWFSNSVSFIDLQTPLTLAGYDDLSQGFGVSGGAVVGQGFWGGQPRAILWTTPVTFTDLTPSGSDGAVAQAAGGGYQAGFAMYGSDVHAARWNGSAASFDDLNSTVLPAVLVSAANGTSGAQTVGYTYDFVTQKAALWNGTSYVSLHPAGFANSIANAVSNGKQVGVGDYFGTPHALLWSGSSAAVDLHSFATGMVSSEAFGVDAGGNVSGRAFDGVNTYAVFWRRTPYFGVFANPINDPATPMSIFKRNSTLHLKIKLYDADGNNLPNQVVRLEVTAIGTLTPGVDETSLAQGSTNGDVFNYDPLTQTYSYLMKTKPLEAGVTYELKAKLDGSNATHAVNIGLR